MKFNPTPQSLMMFSGGLLLAAAAVLGPTGVFDSLPLVGGDKKASADGPAPGEPGDNPCLIDEGGRREETTPEHIREYYAMIGDTLRDEGAPFFGNFTHDDWALVQEHVSNVMANQALTDPSAPYSAQTAWCPGFDVQEDGTTVERKAEWVNGGTPLNYQAHKQYWILYEDEDTIVAILKDCHNLIIIRKPPPPETTTTTAPPPPPTVTQPPPTETTAPPPTNPPGTNPPETTAPPVTNPPETTAPPTTACPPPEGVPPEHWDYVRCEKKDTSEDEQQNETDVADPVDDNDPDLVAPTPGAPAEPNTPPQGPNPEEGVEPPANNGDNGYDSGSGSGSGTPGGSECNGTTCNGGGSTPAAPGTPPVVEDDPAPITTPITNPF